MRPIPLPRNFTQATGFVLQLAGLLLAGVAIVAGVEALAGLHDAMGGLP